MLANEIKPGQIFYGIDVIPRNDVYHMEIYQYKSGEMYQNGLRVYFDVIIGEPGLITFPFDIDLNKGFFAFYHTEALWFYCTDEGTTLAFYKSLLDNESFCINTCFDIWNCKWENYDFKREVCKNN